MARPRSPKRSQALSIWLKSNRELKPKDIAKLLNTSAPLIRKWKSIDRWDDIPITTGKRGAPYGNKNAVGNKGGAPEGNQNAVKHGMFRKWLPNDDELREIYDAAREGMSTLDILHEEILIGFTNFIHAQRVMFVKDKDEMTKEIKKEKTFTGDQGSSEEIEYEIQFAWDKQAKALTSQAAAMRAITSKVKQYEEMVRTLPPNEVKEEHRLRIKKIEADIKAVESKAW